MPTPLKRGEDNPRLCSARTKEEVMANFAKYWEQSKGCSIPPETKQQRMERQADALADSILWHNNTRAAFRPFYEIHGPHLPPSYTDDRSRIRVGRLGQRISD